MSRFRNLVRAFYTACIKLLVCLGAGWLAWFLLDPLINGSLRIKSYSGIVSLVAGTGLTWFAVFECWKVIVPRSKKQNSFEIKIKPTKQSYKKPEDPTNY